MNYFRLWCSFGCLVAFSLNCSAVDLWVDTQSLGGACSNARAASAVTKTTPLCSLGTAASLVAPGDLVHVRAGTYNAVDNCNGCEGRAVLQLRKPGTASQWIRFVAEPGETVILEGTASATIGVRIVPFGNVMPSFNEIQGFQIRKFSLDCVSYDSVPDIRLTGLDVNQCGRQSVALHGAKRATLRGSSIHDSNTNGWTSAIDLYLCKDGNLISGNRIWNNADDSPGNPDSEGHGVIMDYCLTAGGVTI